MLIPWLGTVKTRAAPYLTELNLIQYYPLQEPELFLKLSDLYMRVGNEAAARKTLLKAKRILPANARVQWRF